MPVLPAYYIYILTAYPKTFPGPYINVLKSYCILVLWNNKFNMAALPLLAMLAREAIQF